VEGDVGFATAVDPCVQATLEGTVDDSVVAETSAVHVKSPY
jgi:hypothetical protein